jgi:hypothetical protein
MGERTDARRRCTQNGKRVRIEEMKKGISWDSRNHWRLYEDGVVDFGVVRSDMDWDRQTLHLD